MLPPRSIPVEFRDQFTMGGKIPVEDWYIDETNEGAAKTYTQAHLLEIMYRVHLRAVSGYGPTDCWLYEALRDHPISGKSCVVMGSQGPWYEGISLYYGVRSCTV